MSIYEFEKKFVYVFFDEDGVFRFLGLMDNVGVVVVSENVGFLNFVWRFVFGKKIRFIGFIGVLIVMSKRL